MHGINIFQFIFKKHFLHFNSSNIAQNINTHDIHIIALKFINISPFQCQFIQSYIEKYQQFSYFHNRNLPPQ